MRANLPHSEWQQQNPEPGCFIYSRTLSSNGVSGEGWRECGKQTWLHPSAFQITGGGGGGGGGGEGGGGRGGGLKGWAERRSVVWWICWVQAQVARSCRDEEATQVEVRKKGRQNWEVVWEQKKKKMQKVARKGKVRGRRCRSTVTMRYERNASETHKRWWKNRIAEGEDELFRRAEWIVDDVNEGAACEAWF